MENLYNYCYILNEEYLASYLLISNTKSTTTVEIRELHGVERDNAKKCTFVNITPIIQHVEYTNIYKKIDTNQYYLVIFNRTSTTSKLHKVILYDILDAYARDILQSHFIITQCENGKLSNCILYSDNDILNPDERYFYDEY